MPHRRRRVYEEIRTAFEEQGGTMTFEREGSPTGAWVCTLYGRQRVFHSNGRGFPELNKLYVPKVPNPRHWRDYTTRLVEGALPQFLARCARDE